MMSGMLQQLDEEAILRLSEIPFEINVQYNKNLPHTCIMVPLRSCPFLSPICGVQG